MKKLAQKIDENTLIELQFRNNIIEIVVLSIRSMKRFKTSFDEVPNTMQHYSSLQSFYDMLKEELTKKSIDFDNEALIIEDIVMMNRKQQKRKFKFVMKEENSLENVSGFINQHFVQYQWEETRKKQESQIKKLKDEIGRLEKSTADNVRQLQIHQQIMNAFKLSCMQIIEKLKEQRRNTAQLFKRQRDQSDKQFFRSEQRIAQLETVSKNHNNFMASQKVLYKELKANINGWYFEEAADDKILISKPVISLENISNGGHIKIWKEPLEGYEQSFTLKVISFRDNGIFNFGFFAEKHKEENKDKYKGIANRGSVFFNISKTFLKLHVGGVQVNFQKEPFHEGSTVSFIMNGKNAFTALVNNKIIVTNIGFPKQMNESANNFPYIYMNGKGKIEIECPAKPNK